MNIKFTNKSFEDFSYWIGTDKRKVKRILELIKDIQKHPFEGIGKPEALNKKRGRVSTFDIQSIF